jgi:hypothetical protein
MTPSEHSSDGDPPSMSAMDDSCAAGASAPDVATPTMPSKALAIRPPTCLIHTFDRSRLTCQVCGLRIYVEVRIS